MTLRYRPNQKLSPKLSRRLSLLFFCVAVFGIAYSFPCSFACVFRAQAQEKPQEKQQDTEQKQHLRLGLALEPPHLDPTAGAAAAIDEVVYANVFEGLTRIDEQGRVKPALGESWTRSEDATTFTFRLHKGVRFHDGKPLTAREVAFSLTRTTAPESRNAQQRLFRNIRAVEVLDPHRLRIRLNQADAQFPRNLAWGDAVIVHPDSAANNRNKPIGTGPFRLSSWRRGANLLLVRNDDYWGKKPTLESVRFRFLPEPLAAQAALFAGEIDAFPRFPAPELLKALEKNPRFKVESGTTEGETLLALNLRKPFFQDLRVRQALAHAIDRHALIAGAMFGTAQAIGSHYPPHAADYLDLAERKPYDPQRARRLLQKSGWSKNIPPLTLKLPPPSYARRSGEIIAQQLEAIGIPVRIQPVAWAQWLSEVFRKHDFDLTIVAHTEPDDMEIYAREEYYFGYKSPPFRLLMEKIKATSSEKERRKLRRKAQRHLSEELPAIFLFQLPKNMVRVTNLEGLWKNSPIQANDVTDARFLP